MSNNISTTNKASSGDKPSAEHLESTFPAGTILVSEGEESRKMYVIRKGKARVFRKYLGQHVTLAILSDGEIFGEMSFFDGEPRSASVEALTDLTAIVLDGTSGDKRISDLPSWVHTIFRTVAARFRRLDQQVTILQSVYEFQKKSFKLDQCARTIYTEQLRFIKTITLIHEHHKSTNINIMREDLLSELEGVLGNRFLSLRMFWNLLKEHEYVANASEEISGTVELDILRLKEFENYLEKNIGEENFLLLSQGSLALLRRIASILREGQEIQIKKIAIENLKLSEVFQAEQAIAELKKCAVIDSSNGFLEFEPTSIINRRFPRLSVA